MLPQMTIGLIGLTQPLKLKTVTITSIDFEETEVITVATFQGAVHPAQKQKLNPETVDWSKQYIKCFSETVLNIGQFIEYKNKDFKIIELGNYSEYGYYVGIGEETSKPLLEATL